MPKPDRETKKWIRCPADERAVQSGCRFDRKRAQFVVDWIHRYCRLYEGERAGQVLELRDWQLDATMRIFGWVMPSAEWGREVRRFRRAGVWVPKKNKKSPTLAAWGLYLLCGDGEQGQKCYSVARDGKQAMVAHQHALEMVRRSPELAAECSINKNTGQITHERSRSWYKVVAGDNPRSQEGLNGSVLVDETHVVDRRLMAILKGAGISRSEPLHIEVSTAGNNPDAYGREQFDRGRKAEAAEAGYEDDRVFFSAYAAPQDLSDEDLDADPEKWGRAANPAWGHTILPSEYLADYQTSKRSISDLADFKMYRLNVWQSGSNPWLRDGDWAKCRQDFDEDGLTGRTCYAGLDLSRTRDMSALVLAFPDGPETFKLLPYFWLPEKIAHERNHLAPFLAWSRQGYLELTPGDVIDYGYIRGTFRRLAKRFRILELAYDPRWAEETTQALEQGVCDDAGVRVEEGTGVRRFAFAQSDDSFAAPTADFERLVIAGRLHHNGHPVMNWQAGHAQVMVKISKVKRVVKPTRDDYRTVDGIVAAVMALGRAELGAGTSVYEGRGVLSLGGDEAQAVPAAAVPAGDWRMLFGDDPDEED